MIQLLHGQTVWSSIWTLFERLQPNPLNKVRFYFKKFNMCNRKEEKNRRGMKKYAQKGCDEVLKVPRLHQIVRDARKVNSRVSRNNNANAEQDNHENNNPDTVEVA